MENVKSTERDSPVNIRKILNQLKAKTYQPDHIEEIQNENYPYHYFVFQNEAKNLLDYIILYKDKYDVNGQDELGNTPLIIASMKGHEDCILVLLFMDADVKKSNKDGWNALDESISLGNRHHVYLLLHQKYQTCKVQKWEHLDKCTDFIVDFRWSMDTWVPVLSKLLPSDKCTIIKCGNKIRLNSTLLHFKSMNWEKGNLSYLVNPDIKVHKDKNCSNSKSSLTSNSEPEQKDCNPIFAINHDNKTYEILSDKNINSKKELEKEVSLLMSTEIINVKFNLEKASYKVRKRMWPNNNENQVLQIGDYQATLYDLEDIDISVKKRLEHLNEDYVAETKTMQKNILTGNVEKVLNEKVKRVTGSSLVLPDNDISWESYRKNVINSTTGIPDQSGSSMDLGRKKKMKIQTKHLKLTAGLIKDFPIKKNELVDVLELMFKLGKLRNLRKILESDFLPGFPVYIEVPIIYTTIAKVFFENARVGNPKLDLDPRIFELPSDYKLINESE